MKTNALIRSLSLTAVLAAWSVSVVAQDAPQLILNPETVDEKTIDIDSDQTKPVRIDPVTGDVRLFTDPPDACAGSSDATQSCEDAGVTVDINSLTLDGSSDASVIAGKSVAIAWNTRGAYTCTGSGLSGTTWNGGKSPAGSQSKSVSTGNLELGDYIVRLTCSNGPVTQSATAALSIIEGEVGFCEQEGRVPGDNIGQDTSIIFNSSTPTRTWAETFGHQFPKASKRDIAIGRFQYAALKFNTGDFNGSTFGKVTMTTPSGQFGAAVNSGTRLITFSRCPGDFSNKVDPGCRTTAAPQWEKVDSGSTAKCHLEPNTDYWMNIVYTKQPDLLPINWSCNDGTKPCGNIMDPLSD